MKADPFFRRFTAPLSLIAALTVLTAISVSAQAQPAPRRQAEAERKQAEADQKRVATAGNSVFDIEINDGAFIRKGKGVEATLQNVVDLLRERHDGANIVLSPGLPRIRIANLKLRATTVEQELEALRVASGFKFMWSYNNAPGIDPSTGMPIGGAPGMVPAPTLDPTTGLPISQKENQALYILTETSGNMGPPARVVEVFNLAEYFASLGSGDEDTNRKSVEASVEEIKRIVISTVQVTDEDHSSSIGFQFHTGANLLVAVGTPEAVEVARKVITALAPQARPVNTGRGFGGGFGSGGFNAFGVVSPGPRMSAASSKARRAIQNKLETIRLESVVYDGLPLPEVVRNLIDEAKKRDPEKRGINFLINPNQPPPAPTPMGAPPTIDPTTGLAIPAATAPPPVEPVDINSVSVRIAQPLLNVRLLDVLDAIVKVADHPIRYTITDYAVVFSLRGPDMPMSEAPFPGAESGYTANLP